MYLMGSRSPKERAMLREGSIKYRDTVVICAKMAEPIKMPFGI